MTVQIFECIVRLFHKIQEQEPNAFSVKLNVYKYIISRLELRFDPINNETFYGVLLIHWVTKHSSQITYLSFVASEGSRTSLNCSQSSWERLEVRSSYLRQASWATCCSSAVPRSRLLHSANWCSRSDLSFSGSTDDIPFNKKSSVKCY